MKVRRDPGNEIDQLFMDFRPHGPRLFWLREAKRALGTRMLVANKNNENDFNEQTGLGYLLRHHCKKKENRENGLHLCAVLYASYHVLSLPPETRIPHFPEVPHSFPDGMFHCRVTAAHREQAASMQY